MSEAKGLKEINEVFDGLDILAEFGGSVMADGAVSVTDVASLVALATKFDTLSEAVKGAKEALEEGKDLDKAEVLVIIGRVYGVVEKFAQSKK